MHYYICDKVEKVSCCFIVHACKMTRLSTLFIIHDMFCVYIFCFTNCILSKCYGIFLYKFNYKKIAINVFDTTWITT